MYVIAISPRFSLGRSTPATLAIRFLRLPLYMLASNGDPSPLPLSLLVPRVLADHPRDALPLDDLAVLAAHLDRRSDFHDPSLPSFYLNRYVIRPRVRSYGDSSTFTRSPGRMRMKFMRILPLTCASTRWPLSSSTRNIAFGSGSTTVPSTSIASSFGMSFYKLASDGGAWITGSPHDVLRPAIPSRHLDGTTRPARQDLGLRVRDG